MDQVTVYAGYRTEGKCAKLRRWLANNPEIVPRGLVVGHVHVEKIKPA